MWWVQNFQDRGMYVTRVGKTIAEARQSWSLSYGKMHSFFRAWDRERALHLRGWVGRALSPFQTELHYISPNSHFILGLILLKRWILIFRLPRDSTWIRGEWRPFMETVISLFSTCYLWFHLPAYCVARGLSLVAVCWQFVFWIKEILVPFCSQWFQQALLCSG